MRVVFSYYMPTAVYFNGVECHWTRLDVRSPRCPGSVEHMHGQGGKKHCNKRPYSVQLPR